MAPAHRVYLARRSFQDEEPEESEFQEESQEEQSPPRTPRPQAQVLSVEEELARGDEQEAELVEKFPLWQSQMASELLADCLEHLRPALIRKEVDYSFQAVDSTTAFTSTCSNGRVFFSRGLMEGLAEEQVLYFAAQELARTELRHFATRPKRLAELRGAVATAPGSQARQRLEFSAVLAIRHFEDFEADFQASQWLGHGLAQQALAALHSLHRTQSVALSSDQAKLETRIQRVSQQMKPPDAVNYLYSLMGY